MKSHTFLFITFTTFESFLWSSCCHPSEAQVSTEILAKQQLKHTVQTCMSTEGMTGFFRCAVGFGPAHSILSNGNYAGIVLTKMLS